MDEQFSSAGAATEELCRKAHELWFEEVTKLDVTRSRMDLAASLADRISQAKSMGLLTAAVLSHFADYRHRPELQVQQCVIYAAQHEIYVPPEFICVDEATGFHTSTRDGLEHTKEILRRQLVDVLLVSEIGRLFRAKLYGFTFIQENVVDRDLRAISVSDGIDTANERAWKRRIRMYRRMNEMVSEANLEDFLDHQ